MRALKITNKVCLLVRGIRKCTWGPNHYDTLALQLVIKMHGTLSVVHFSNEHTYDFLSVAGNEVRLVHGEQATMTQTCWHETLSQINSVKSVHSLHAVLCVPLFACIILCVHPSQDTARVPAIHWWLSGNVKLGLMWGSVVHWDVFVLVCCAFCMLGNVHLLFLEVFRYSLGQGSKGGGVLFLATAQLAERPTEPSPSRH